MEYNRRKLSRGEELFNSITHGLGALLSIAALVILVVAAARHGNGWHITGFAIYGVSLVLLYTASALYHSFPDGQARNLFARFDHSAIFLLIAGTYTPMLLTVMRNSTGWTLFGIVWGIALAGITLRSIFLYRFRQVMVVLYLVMGWMFLFAARDIAATLPKGSLHLLLAGGLLYSGGVVFYAWRKLPYSHGIWHLFVLGGSIAHFFAILAILEL